MTSSNKRRPRSANKLFRCHRARQAAIAHPISHRAVKVQLLDQQEQPESRWELASLADSHLRHCSRPTRAFGTFTSSPLVCRYEFRLIRGSPAAVPARKRSFCSPVKLSMSSLRNVAWPCIHCSWLTQVSDTHHRSSLGSRWGCPRASFSTGTGKEVPTPRCYPAGNSCRPSRWQAKADSF